MLCHLRIARPVSDLVHARHAYCAGLDLRIVGSFIDHAGFDGVMLGGAGAGFHFEFTHCRHHPVRPQPTSEDLVVLYLPDRTDWERRCAAMEAAGFATAPSFNPYWDLHGRTFLDTDGYRTVLQNAAWSNAEEESATTNDRPALSPCGKPLLG